MTEGRGDRLGRIVLPGLCLESDDAPALLGGRRLGIAVQRAARAQVVGRQGDRLGDAQSGRPGQHNRDSRRVEEGARPEARDGGRGGLGRAGGGVLVWPTRGAGGASARVRGGGGGRPMPPLSSSGGGTTPP